MSLLRAHRDDSPEAAGCHPWPETLAEQKWGLKIDGHRLVPDPFVQFIERRAQVHPGGVNQNVRLSAGLDGGGRGRADSRPGTEVADHRRYMTTRTADLRGRGIQSVPIASDDDGCRTRPREAGGNRKSDARTAAGHQRVSALEGEQVSQVLVDAHADDSVAAASANASSLRLIAAPPIKRRGLARLRKDTEEGG